VLLRELEASGTCVGVTSVGRDGEEHDVIDARISKPRVHLAAGSLVATTDGLLRASAIEHELLEQTSVRTPLGRVIVARLRQPGAIEVAGPSAAADVRAVSDAMLAHGAHQVLIDGAVDRRAASSPAVSDGLVMATGAVLADAIEDVVAQTRDAVELARLPLLEDASAAGARLRALAGDGHSLLLDEQGDPLSLPPRFLLTADAAQIAALLDERPGARWLLAAGAVPEGFLLGLAHALQRRQRELVLVAADPTRVFLWKRGPEWFRRRGLHLQALERIELEALTVNPVAPQSHRFDSRELRSLLGDVISGVPILDVLDLDYTAMPA